LTTKFRRDLTAREHLSLET